MILVDANMLVYVYSPSYPVHREAVTWLDRALNGLDRIGLPWASTLAFTRIITNKRLFANPPPLDAAWAQVRRWLSSPVAWVPGPTPDHATLVTRLLATPGLKHDDMPDVHLAAIALGHGLEVCSHDAGFARFDGLRHFDPLR